MTRLIHCAKLNKEAMGLPVPPMPGTMGQKVYEQISKEAWQLWLTHQTMFINENRLSMIEPAARTRVMQELDQFLFGPDSSVGRAED